jgi:undecaprenyl-diphosphatase
MPLEETLRDTTALGGNAVYAIVALMFFLTGDTETFVYLALALIMLYAIISIVRLFFFRTRPDKQKYSGFFTKIDAGSFPSLHSARATVLAIVTGTAFPDIAIRAVLALGVLAVVVTRVVLKRHYISDVIAGVALGGIVAWLTFFIHPLFIGGI